MPTIYRIALLNFFVLLAFLSFGQTDLNSRIDSLETELREAHDISQKIKLQLSLSRHYLKIDPQKSKSYVHAALSLSLNAQIDDYLAETYGVLGDIAVMEDSLVMASKYYKKSYDLFELIQDKRNLSGLSRVLGNIAIVQTDYSQAMLYYHQAIKFAKDTDMEAFLGAIYVNIGVLNLEAGNAVESQKYLSIALEEAQKNNDTAIMAIVYLNFGQSYLDINDSASARKYLNDAFKLYKLVGTPADMSLVYRNFAKLEKLKKNYPAAINYLNKGIEYGMQEDLDYLGPKNIILSESYSEMGENYLALNKIDEALKYFRNALQLGFINGEFKVVANSAKGLSDIWYRENNIDSAFFYLKLFKEYSDSLMNEENIRKLANLDANFKYEQLLAAEEQQRIAEDAKQRRNSLIMLFVIVGLVLTVIILFLFLKLGRSKIEKAELQKNNLKKELEIRNKELTTHVIYQLKNNEFILNISNKLSALLSKLQPENKKIIEEVIHEIATDSGNEIWKEFEVRFHKVHTDFYKNLSNKFPDLTPNELKLSAFLKLNMNTKDIAAITYQSTNSIDVGRSRLRQKLGLNKDESLSTFLSRF